jgi:hypothetical protein
MWFNMPTCQSFILNSLIMGCKHSFLITKCRVLLVAICPHCICHTITCANFLTFIVVPCVDFSFTQCWPIIVMFIHMSLFYSNIFHLKMQTQLIGATYGVFCVAICLGRICCSPTCWSFGISLVRPCVNLLFDAYW